MCKYIMVLMVAIVTSGPAFSQELGSVSQGQELAQTVCAECHAVAPGAIRSPNAHAPTFDSIARMPGMTPMAIRVWLRSAHKEMPNIMLSRDETDNVIAYLASLKADSSLR
jgi:mono/diheme cytochrome c family protein